MNVVPVIKRELRAQARQPFTFWLRAAAVAVMLVAVAVFGLHREVKPGEGAALLSTLHACLFVGIWILVPTLTADCLSGERREGTLGLLFLTNLRPFDIVLAKAMVHALRAVTFCLAALPAMTLPFLIGGAGWQHAMLSVLLNVSALCLALGAGVLASARCKSWSRAVVLSVCSASLAFLVFSVVHLWILVVATGVRTGQQSLRGLLEGLNISETVMVVLQLPRVVAYFSQTKGAVPGILAVETALASVGVLFLFCCIWMAARTTAKSMRDETASVFARWLERRLCTPVVAVDFLKYWMRRTLARNPVGWLEVRSWNARLTVWSWFGLIVLFYSYALSDFKTAGPNTLRPQSFIGWLLAGSIAFNAAGSFRRERETGVLELLLVSPLSVSEIVNGRLLGIWGQFLPATGLFAGISATLAGYAPSHRESDMTWFFVIAFLTLPVIGLYFSLARQQFFSAVVWTLGVGLILPALIEPVSHWLISALGLPGWKSSPMTRASPFQITVAVVLWERLHRYLVERRFKLEHSDA